MPKKFFSLENILFVGSLIGLFAVIFGIVPRHAILLLALALSIYFLWAPWRNGLLFFVRMIPFFFALPLTANFDNFNFWRVALALIFLKWLYEKKFFWPALRRSYSLNNVLPTTWHFIRAHWRTYTIEILGVTLLILAAASVIVAYDPISAVKRLLYFVNLVVLFVLVRDAVRTDGPPSSSVAEATAGQGQPSHEAAARQGEKMLISIAKNFLAGALILCAVGFLQWGSAYLVPAWIFHYWWGHIVSANLYGNQWSNIVLNSGNTWFSYSGGGLRLRMFSLFPDSHTFPIYLLLALPSLFLVLSLPLQRIMRWLLMGAFVLLHLALILSGTRGIWASIAAPVLVAAVGWLMYPALRKFIKRVSLSLLAFLLLFPIAWIITSFPQFQHDGIAPNDTFISRLNSVFDAGEISNRGRILIWKHTIQSIAHNPALGVGIGNFPLILREQISSTKAGASAHNLFLHVAAEMGIPALLIFLWLCWEIRGRLTAIARNADVASPVRLYAVATLFSFAWILAYSFTDAALFDERAFLGFMVFIGTIVPILAQKKGVPFEDSLRRTLLSDAVDRGSRND